MELSRLVVSCVQVQASDDSKGGRLLIRGRSRVPRWRLQFPSFRLLSESAVAATQP